MEQKIERTFVKQEEEESRKNNNNKKMCGKRAGCTERSGYVFYKSNIDRKRLKARMKAIKLSARNQESITTKSLNCTRNGCQTKYC